MAAPHHLDLAGYCASCDWEHASDRLATLSETQLLAWCDRYREELLALYRAEQGEQYGDWHDEEDRYDPADHVRTRGGRLRLRGVGR